MKLFIFLTLAASSAFASNYKTVYTCTAPETSVDAAPIVTIVRDDFNELALRLQSRGLDKVVELQFGGGYIVDGSLLKGDNAVVAIHNGVEEPGNRGASVTLTDLGVTYTCTDLN